MREGGTLARSRAGAWMARGYFCSASYFTSFAVIRITGNLKLVGDGTLQFSCLPSFLSSLSLWCSLACRAHFGNGDIHIGSSTIPGLPPVPQLNTGAAYDASPPVCPPGQELGFHGGARQRAAYSKRAKIALPDEFSPIYTPVAKDL